MRILLTAIGLLLTTATLYLLLWPVPIDPVAWEAPESDGLVDPFAPNDRLAPARGIPLGAHIGPEDVTAGSDGLLYATSKDGFVLQIDAWGKVHEFAEVGGRALGIETDADGTLLVANAYVGIQRIALDGGVTILLDEFGGEPLVYADDLAVGDDGTIYFSDASTKFGAEQYSGTYEGSLLDIMEHGGHGRIIAFNPATGESRLVLDGLQFANGVAISPDQRYLLVAETGSYRILRHWIAGPAAGSTEVILDNLPGFPDNINNGLNGRYWIGLVAPRSDLLDSLSGNPFVRKIVQRLPEVFRPKAMPSSHVIAITGDGQVLENMQDPAARFPALTGVYETRDALYLTSLFGNELGVLDKRDLLAGNYSIPSSTRP
ncbi:MAG: SMP-30/gluconolactonase/LRE family protein [Woeseiaceae bacterium]|nr:SMP-30/gluconolactonase/LRE family protein [Woeseiaceae bacterium]